MLFYKHLCLGFSPEKYLLFHVVYTVITFYQQQCPFYLFIDNTVRLAGHESVIQSYLSTMDAKPLSTLQMAGVIMLHCINGAHALPKHHHKGNGLYSRYCWFYISVHYTAQHKLTDYASVLQCFWQKELFITYTV